MKHFSCTWALLLRLHSATFSHWERSFWASVASPTHNLLSCTKHRIGALRSYKEVILFQLSPRMTFSCKKTQNHEHLSSVLQKTFNFIRNKHFSCFWALLLKLNLLTFSHWKISFWASVSLVISSFALNTELVLLEAIKKWFVQLSSKMTFCKKA